MAGDEQAVCKILDDADLEAAQRLEWRRAMPTRMELLFQTPKGKPEFPKAFQTYRAGLSGSGQPRADPNFPFQKGTRSRAKQKRSVDASGSLVPLVSTITDISGGLAIYANFTEDDDPPYAPCTP